MQFQNFLIPAAVLLGLGVSYQQWGWPGVALAAGLVVMWVLMHFTRMMQILKRAANRPIGYVDSAVMLNAKLKPGVTLMHVIAMTRSLGTLLTPKDAQPELFRWIDPSDATVTCEFVGGKLKTWELNRPQAEDAAQDSAQPT